MTNRKKGKLVVKVGNWWSCGQDDWTLWVVPPKHYEVLNLTSVGKVNLGMSNDDT